MNIHLLTAVILSLAITGTIACSTKAADDTKTNITTGTPKLPVDVQVVSATPLNQSEVIAGSIIPNREVVITSEVTKKIVAVLFKDGSQVVQGQVLYKLDDADIRARIKQLHAELQLAEINEGRLRELRKTETVRQEEYDAAYARLQTLKATEDVLKVELSKTFIKAPFSGKVGISRVHTGTVVSPGLPLVSLQEQGTIKVQFAISEKHLPLIRKGGAIQFSTALNTMQQATVVATEPGVDMQSRTITVQAIAPNPSGILKPGMSAKVYFKTHEDNATSMMLPTQALIPGGNGYNVFVVKGGVAKMTPVTIGHRNEEQALVTRGLNNGDSVMVSNILRAMDGTPVQIINHQLSQN